jgi:hypothetical protein
MAAITRAATRKPTMSPTLLRDRKLDRADKPCGSGFSNASTRPGNSEELDGLFGSKQYCVKH